MIDMLQGAAWAAYNERVAASERAQGNPDGAAFYQRQANRARHSLSQLRGHDTRGGRAALLPCDRPVSLSKVVASAGGVAATASGLFDERPCNGQSDGLGCGVESVPVHGDGVIHVY
jgi:hypothetical protein